jgi:hypothetical protein
MTNLGDKMTKANLTSNSQKSRILLGARDLDILTTTYRHGFLLRDHLHALAFGDCDVRRVNRRLRALTQHGLLRSMHLPLGAFAIGMEDLIPQPGQFCYRIADGDAGVEIIAQTLEVDITTIRRRVRMAPSYVGHCIAVTALHVAMNQFQKAHRYRLHNFLTESEARYQFEWRENSASSWQTNEVRPDTLAWLERDERRASLFLEADMATQSKTVIAAKLEAYKTTLRVSALTKRLEGTPFRLGIVTTSATRLDQLVSLVRESDINDFTDAVGVTTFRDFIDKGALAPIWTIPKKVIAPSTSGERNKNYHALL